MPRNLLERVVVVGAGLIGTSIALALRHAGVVVHLTDADPRAAKAAAALGAGTTEPPDGVVDLAIFAVPPGQVGPTLAQAQARGVAKVYTDVASVKSRPLADVQAAGGDLASYVGGHPMAGRERSGPAAARSDLFKGRPWVVVSPSVATESARSTVLELVALCGAIPETTEAQDHDRAVGLVSHAPHVLSSLMAAQLRHLDSSVVGLAGRGLRDVVRLAGGNSLLWADILSSNATFVGQVLDNIAVDLKAMATALRQFDSEGLESDGEEEKVMATLIELLDRGRSGHSRLSVSPDVRGFRMSPCPLEPDSSDLLHGALVRPLPRQSNGSER